MKLCLQWREIGDPVAVAQVSKNRLNAVGHKKQQAGYSVAIAFQDEPKGASYRGDVKGELGMKNRRQ